MTEHSGRWEQVENELAEIGAEITALGDMIPLVIQYEDMEPGTPGGIKLLFMEIRDRLDRLRKRLDSNLRQAGESASGQS